MALAYFKCCTVFLFYSLILLHALPRSHNAHLEVKPLSDEKHYSNNTNGEHNVEFDHEAFLGEKEAKKFEDLTPEESKHELGFIFTKIDLNKDDHLSESEMKTWIKKVNRKYAFDEADKNWNEIKPVKENFISFPEHRLKNYGSEESIAGDDRQDIREMIQRDEKRWKVADRDGDSLLSKEEYAAFLYPETADFMKDIVVEESLEDIDTDDDGYISLEEFLNDLGNEDDEEEGEWMEAEERDFQTIHDKDKDGRLDRNEVADWLQLEDNNQIDDEADHLFVEADANRDHLLSRDEVINNYELFVGSQATDYGDLLVQHDEF